MLAAGKGSTAAETRLAGSRSATGAAAIAAVRQATRGSDGETRPADMLNSDGYDISVVDSMSNEDLKHVIYQIQDYPSGASASHKVGGPARHFASMMGSTVAHCNTPPRRGALAQGSNLPLSSSSRDRRARRRLHGGAAAACGHDCKQPHRLPIALWLDFVRAASVQPERDEPEATDSSTPDGVREGHSTQEGHRSL
jgi:hypothetical protein